MSTKHLTKHEINEPDPILLWLRNAVQYSRENRARLIPLAIAAVIALAGGTFAVKWIAARNARANLAVASLLQIYNRPVGTDAKDAFATQSDKDQAIAAAAGEVLDEHGSARSARGALVLEARTRAREGHYREAAELFGRAIGSAAPQDAIGAAAALSRATMQAAAGDSTGAIAELERLAGSGNPYLPEQLLLSRAADIAESSGDYPAALSLWQRVAKADDPTLSSRARQRVEELGKKVDEAGADGAGSS